MVMFGFGPSSGLPFRARVGFGHKNWACLQYWFCVLNNKPFRVNFYPFSLSESINLHITVFAMLHVFSMISFAIKLIFYVFFKFSCCFNFS